MRGIQGVAALLLTTGCLSDAHKPATSTTPIAEHFGLPLTASQSVSQERDEHAAAEELIRSCMVAAGFDYLARPYGVDGLALDTSSPSIYESLERRTRYGFGLLAGNGPPDLPSDPNLEGLQRLGEEERTAWWVQLLGEDDSQEMTPESCAGQAWASIAQQRPSAPLASLSHELDDLEARIASDPDVVAALAEWQRCAAARGFVFDSPRAARLALVQRIQAESTSDHDLRAYEVRLATETFVCDRAFIEAEKPTRDRHEHAFVERLG